MTGGTGVVGPATVTELLRQGHTVRLLSRHASEESRPWPARVEALDASVADAEAIRGAADGCEAVVHMAAIVAESPPEATFDRVNVEGTRNIVREAERAGVRRFVYVSSLGANRGKSPYHVSKFAAEKVALASAMNTTVLRLANVYGSGDQVVSLLIKMVRVSPVIPAIDGGGDEFQPIWVDDAARAIAECVARDDLTGQSLDVAGPDRTCMNDLIERMRDITGRTPSAVPVPGGIVALGARMASALGINVPVDSGQITMLEEGNAIRDDEVNALDAVLHVKPTPLVDGLKQLADSLPEQLPHDGVGSLTRKRVWACITGSPLTPEGLFARFRDSFGEVTPWTMDVGTEPGTPTEPTAGETLTMAVPLRGNVQVRVEELDERSMVLVTLEGHPLAGAVRFLSERRGDDLRFEVQVYDRSANAVDWLAMRTIGQFLQLGTWRSIVRGAVELSGGTAPDGVQVEVDTLDEEQAKRVEAWVRDLVVARQRETTHDPRQAPRGGGDEAEAG